MRLSFSETKTKSREAVDGKHEEDLFKKLPTFVFSNNSLVSRTSSSMYTTISVYPPSVEFIDIAKDSMVMVRKIAICQGIERLDILHYRKMSGSIAGRKVKMKIKHLYECFVANRGW